jgi:alpha/beta superfamily hydrolase
MEPNKQSLSLGQKWSTARPTKTVVFWSCVASAVVTMIIGFSWGGWVTGSTARSMATVNGEDAVVKRLAPICVVRFTQDPGKDLKLKEVQATDTWQRGDYVKKQGWATMPGEKEPDGKVADECVKLLMLTSSK